MHSRVVWRFISYNHLLLRQLRARDLLFNAITTLHQGCVFSVMSFCSHGLKWTIWEVHREKWTKGKRPSQREKRLKAVPKTSFRDFWNRTRPFSVFCLCVTCIRSKQMEIQRSYLFALEGNYSRLSSFTKILGYC